MTFQEFLNKFNGQSNVGNTPENKGECVGLVSVWVDNLGYDHIWGHAKDLVNNYNPNQFDFILNTPEAMPEQGDIICWNSTMGGGYGHTAIATGGQTTLTTFEVFEQNNPTGSNCHLKTYPNYNNVIGWLRPKKIVVGNELQACLEAHRQAVESANRKDEEIKVLNQKIEDLQATEKRLKEEYGKLQTEGASKLALEQSVRQSWENKYNMLVDGIKKLL